jgi:hypothetical protein
MGGTSLSTIGMPAKDHRQRSHKVEEQNNSAQASLLPPLQDIFSTTHKINPGSFRPHNHKRRHIGRS